MHINFDHPSVRSHMFEGGFGLEKESLRVSDTGRLSQTKHPFGDDPRMDRDFCENQTELITSVCNSSDDAWKQLADLHKTAVINLLKLKTGREFFWPFSNPPFLCGEDDIPIASFDGQLKGKEIYRQYLAEKYGKSKMLFSGIHFNFSFSDRLLQAAFRESVWKGSYFDFRNQVYLHIAEKAAEYSWLIVYLTAASPVIDSSFFTTHSSPVSGLTTERGSVHESNDVSKNATARYSSVRCSEIGYWNHFLPLLEYGTLEEYTESIQSYIDDGQLKSISELYYPVRLKPPGENSLENLKKHGVSHIELRMIDLNPLSSVGLRREDVIFLHLLLLYLISMPDELFSQSDQRSAVENVQRAAAYDTDSLQIETGWNQTRPIKEAALAILDDMEAFFSSFASQSIQNAPSDLMQIIRFQKEKLLSPGQRYAEIIRKEFSGDTSGSYTEKGLRLAKKYANQIAAEYRHSSSPAHGALQ